jgi:NAD(P)-dependent dehydrogenase (short-subunit alcohol dehydrogenase family)
MTELSGASIIVVGASGGLGSLIARQLADHGALVTLVGRHDSTLSGLGLPGDVVACDITDDTSRQGMVNQVVASRGAIDGVVYAAGAVAFGPAGELSASTLDALWKVNTRAAMMLLQEVTPALQASSESGRQPFFVTLSGVVAESPTAGLAAYSAVKSALHAHMTAASREMRRLGIRLLDARPGHTETELSKHPLAGVAPAFPPGMTPEHVASRIVQAIVSDEKDLPSGAFAPTS